ncbi:MAG TPA: hypothetical protein VLT90_11140 [Terriglobales bacterium]|nr:hypothetical protein [Terriglobales bacterium]
MSWYWNNITDKDSARYATTTAVWISYFLAAAFGVMAIVDFMDAKLVSQWNWIFGMPSVASLEAALFLVIAWGIASLSRAGSTVGVTACSLLILSALSSDGSSVGMIVHLIVGSRFLVAYINALRGTLAYHKFAY